MISAHFFLSINILYIYKLDIPSPIYPASVPAASNIVSRAARQNVSVAGTGALEDNLPALAAITATVLAGR